jgi:hypothetical protein
MMGSIVIATPPRASDVATLFPCADGDVLVVPHVLPFRVSSDALGLTVAEWLGIPDRP